MNFKETIRKILKEAEDDLGWAEETISNKEYKAEWIRTTNGKRFKEKGVHRYDEEWQRFNGWDNWYRVNSIKNFGGKLCFTTNLTTSAGKSNPQYYTPVEDYNYNEVSPSLERPKMGNEKMDQYDI